MLFISAWLIENFSFLYILFTKLYKKYYGVNIVIPDLRKWKKYERK